MRPRPPADFLVHHEFFTTEITEDTENSNFTAEDVKDAEKLN